MWGVIMGDDPHSTDGDVRDSMIVQGPDTGDYEHNAHDHRHEELHVASLPWRSDNFVDASLPL
jgi:hypothetical protein